MMYLKRLWVWLAKLRGSPWFICSGCGKLQYFGGIHYGNNRFACSLECGRKLEEQPSTP